MAKKITSSSAPTNSGGNKKILWFAGAIALGVGAYFGYKWWKKRQENPNGNGNGTPQQDNNPVFQQDPVVVSQPTVSQPTVSQPTVSSLTTNPFTTQDELIKFQQWVINTKKDTTILGSGGSTGFGDDGKWGKKSASAWDKYGAEYQKSTAEDKKPDGKGLDKDTIQVLVYTREDGNRVAWGNKATENYIQSSKYPKFFNTWKDAVLRRLKSGGNTLFYWGGTNYDSYTGTAIVNGTISGRGLKAGENTYKYDDQKQKGEKVAKGTNLGQVKNYTYSKKDNTLWLNNGTNWYKYPYVKLI